MQSDTQSPDETHHQPTTTTRYAHLTGFQRDILRAIAYLEQDGDPPHGLGIKYRLDDRYGEDINHGRLYPNFDELVEAGFIEKGTIDRRTNSYELTDSAWSMLELELDTYADQLGHVVHEPQEVDR